jgi:lipid-A-disaccharide synthase
MDFPVVQELIQHILNRENLTFALQKISEPEIRKKISENYSKLYQRLGGTGASARTAELIFKQMST